MVWSEHWRPYKRDTLPTQFCDVLVVLYPLPGGLLRCTVARKPDVSSSIISFIPIIALNKVLLGDLHVNNIV